jgi:hypothetical protein
MKKLLSFLCTSLIVLTLFAVPVNPVEASETDIPNGEGTEATEPCICEFVKEVTGVERNKIVANLLKSDDFKDASKVWKVEGYKWNGAKDIQVIKHDFLPVVIIGVPVIRADGKIMMAGFVNGKYGDITDPEDDSHNHLLTN